MTESGTPGGTTPKALKVARVIMYIQAVAGILGAAWLWYELVEVRLEHGQQVRSPGLVYFSLVSSFLLAVVLLVCAARVASRRRWIRPTVVTIEVIVILNWLISLVFGILTAPIGVLMAVAVLVAILRPEVQESQESVVDQDPSW